MKKSSLPLLMLVSFLLIFTQNNWGQGLSTDQIDNLVQKTMKTFDVPGMAVAVLKDGKVLHMKGYGTRSLEKGGKVDENTLFGVASNTKAMTAAALAILIDQGKLEWDTKVTEVIPEFKLYDPYVTSEFTVRDLLTHRSGLGLGAGDLMVWPSLNTTSKEELIHNLRYLKPVSSFRTKYDYDNLLYIVAGVVVEKVSGLDYETFITQNIFRPLGMNNSVVNWNLIKDKTNVIEGHAPTEGKLVTVGLSFTPAADPAAGVYSSVYDMSKWVQMQLDNGKFGTQLKDSIFSKEQHREMWTPQTIIRTGPGDYNTQFKAYGLGWNLSDVNGYKEVTHTGGLLGIVSQVTMIPQLELGIIVLTNQQSGAAFRSVTNSIKDAYFGIKGKDRIAQYHKNVLRNEKYSDSVVANVWKNVEAVQKNQKMSTAELSKYSGAYLDPWFGKVNILVKDGKLRFEAEKAPDLHGEMSFYKGNSFVVKWDDRSLNGDAFAVFSLDREGEANGFTMEPVSPMTDFSFDFQDLEFEKQRK
ncbi:serine hydrolase [Antarcticibacterium arcticum]|uniref:Serine hydrolase n=1 Tax=Antarcticibacterium arcticum TaxID=2585771 RepID=A0A5B8YLP4_9FLAO|nr:serine hydrolase [Antarcticibacterium arcticum]QED36649.1 serine hydrolase [Antarcticibacterium arcticum]